MLGFLSPANRGSMLTVTLLLFVLMGSVAGYCAAVTYKAFKGAQWKALTLLTAFLYPGITFGIFFVLNLFIWGQASSGAVPFGTMFALLCIWFLISFPLVWVGVWLGYRRVLKDPPVKTNMVPRVIPSQAWYLNQLFTMLIGGVLPFGAVFIELYFIMSSVWLQRFYYVFGFLALVLLILLITCGEMAIVLCYFQLCNENYMWQWRAFLNTGSAGLFLFGYRLGLGFGLGFGLGLGLGLGLGPASSSSATGHTPPTPALTLLPDPNSRPLTRAPNPHSNPNPNPNPCPTPNPNPHSNPTSGVYFSSTLEIMGVVSTMLYFGYMCLASTATTIPKAQHEPQTPTQAHPNQPKPKPSPKPEPCTGSSPRWASCS